MSNDLARNMRLDVTADLTLSGGWLQVNGLSDFNDDITPNLEDSTAYDTNGWKTQEPTLQTAQLSATFFRRQNAGVYDPGQELIRACRGQFGNAARLGARWYQKNGGPEASMGVFIPTWKKANTAVGNLIQAATTFDLSDGTVQTISNPAAGSIIPIVTSVSPAGQNTGKIVTIVGGGFTGTTGVTVGGTAVTSFVVESDAMIVAVLPSGSAGSAPVVVTNAAGASAAAPFVRGA